MYSKKDSGFYEFFLLDGPTRNAYCFDAPRDHIADIMREVPVVANSNEPVTRRPLGTYINVRTLQLLYTLHRLNVRPT